MKLAKMKDQTSLSEVVSYLDTLAPSPLQESYDNAGIQAGNPAMIIRSALVTVDVTEDVVDEAIECDSNLIVAHHPVIFGNIRRLTGGTSAERILIKAVRNDIAIVAVHTNLDNVTGGVNTKIAEKLGLIDASILQPVKGRLRKLVTFIPTDHLDSVRQAIFGAGAGHIGDYDQCSFSAEGKGTFRGGNETHPFAGKAGKFHVEPELRFETIFPSWLESQIVDALIKTHPYEEVAYDIYPLENSYIQAGAGMTGKLPFPLGEKEFLQKLKETFQIPVIRHSMLRNRPVSKVAVCGGAGSFLLKEAIASGADFFITGDIKYHQFFDAFDKIVLADVGHFESEQFTKELFYKLLTKKFHTFAVRLSETVTNPVNYFG